MSSTPTSRQPTVRSARPLLKWAGGKRQLLPELRRFYPPSFTTYFEPFVGSGAVFFDLHASGRLDGGRVVLADGNPDLIGCYRMVRDRTGEVIDALARLERAHRRRGDAHYYEVRDRFNAARAALDPGAAEAYTPALAAMLVYLNRTAFNGLFRLNARGQFNVPAGRYAAPRICDPDHVRAVAAALARPRLKLEVSPFDAVLRRARAGDFLYFDPPYAPLSETSRFTSYTARPFTHADQERLRDVVVDLSRRGCAVVVSNSSAPEIAALYEEAPAVRDAGLRVYRVPARRAINSKASSRGAVVEVILANTRPLPIDD